MLPLEYGNNRDNFRGDVTQGKSIGKKISHMPYRRIASFNGYFYKEDFLDWYGCPIFLARPGLVLGSQFIYMVGYEFPTMGSPQPDYLAVLLCPCEIPPSPPPLSSKLLFILSIISH